jgi:hypothetical protein
MNSVRELLEGLSLPAPAAGAAPEYALPGAHLLSAELPQGHLHVWSGPPGAGKTAFLLGLLREAARRGRGALLATYDLSAPALALRMLAMDTGVPLDDLDGGRLTCPGDGRRALEGPALDPAPPRARSPGAVRRVPGRPDRAASRAVRHPRRRLRRGRRAPARAARRRDLPGPVRPGPAGVAGRRGRRPDLAGRAPRAGPGGRRRSGGLDRAGGGCGRGAGGVVAGEPARRAPPVPHAARSRGRTVRGRSRPREGWPRRA